jgi:hypothetical protein
VSAGKVALLIFGILILLVSFGLLAGGSSLLWVNANHVDNQGFFTSDTIHIVRNSSAVAVGPIELDDVALRVLRTMGLITVFNFEGTNNNPSKQIFMGVADQAILENYLENVAYDEITDFDLGWNLDFNKVSYTNHPGTSLASIPTSKSIWTVSAVGTGSETLQWQTEAGNNSFVLMNSDGSSGVDLNVIFKAKIPSLIGYGLGLLIAGIVVLIIGGTMVLFAVRK